MQEERSCSVSEGRPHLPPPFLTSRVFLHHVRSPAVSHPGHAWLLVPPRKELRPQCACLPSGKGIPPQPGMTHHDATPADKGTPEEDTIHLALPGLLPEHHTLILNPSIRTLILHNDEPDAVTPVVTEHQFPPNAMRILITLLQAYPKYCRYEVLLAQLYPISVAEGRRQLQEARETTMRPLRRAVSSITAGLQPFGLRVCSIHSVGFVIEGRE
jgi:hypothetical protein